MTIYRRAWRKIEAWLFFRRVGRLARSQKAIAIQKQIAAASRSHKPTRQLRLEMARALVEG